MLCYVNPLPNNTSTIKSIEVYHVYSLVSRMELLTSRRDLGVRIDPLHRTSSYFEQTRA